MIVGNTKFAKMQFWSALHFTFIASSESVYKSFNSSTDLTSSFTKAEYPAFSKVS